MGGVVRGIGFIGGEGPGAKLSAALAGEADLIAAADSGLMAAEAAGLRPDWIVGDMDSLDEPRRLDRYPPDRVFRGCRDKDETDTELLLSLLWEKGCDEVWLLGGGGGRMDHLLAIQTLFEREKSPDRWITAGEDVRLVREGLSLSIGPEPPGALPPGRLVSVFPLGTGPWEAESRGLKWPLAGLPWKRGFFGLSNLAPGGGFEIRALGGFFLVIMPFGKE
jgi:thiamine pyrophosphokinase